MTPPDPLSQSKTQVQPRSGEGTTQGCWEWGFTWGTVVVCQRGCCRRKDRKERWPVGLVVVPVGSTGAVLVSDSRGATTVGVKGPRNTGTGTAAQSFRSAGGGSILKNEKWVTAKISMRGCVGAWPFYGSLQGVRAGRRGLVGMWQGGRGTCRRAERVQKPAYRGPRVAVCPLCTCGLCICEADQLI